MNLLDLPRELLELISEYVAISDDEGSGAPPPSPLSVSSSLANHSTTAFYDDKPYVKNTIHEECNGFHRFDPVFKASRNLFPLLRVCKYWADIVEPMIFHTVQICHCSLLDLCRYHSLITRHARSIRHVRFLTHECPHAHSLALVYMSRTEDVSSFRHVYRMSVARHFVVSPSDLTDMASAITALGCNTYGIVLEKGIVMLHLDRVALAEKLFAFALTETPTASVSIVRAQQNHDYCCFDINPLFLIGCIPNASDTLQRVHIECDFKHDDISTLLQILFQLPRLEHVSLCFVRNMCSIPLDFSFYILQLMARNVHTLELTYPTYLVSEVDTLVNLAISFVQNNFAAPRPEALNPYSKYAVKGVPRDTRGTMQQRLIKLGTCSPDVVERYTERVREANGHIVLLG